MAYLGKVRQQTGIRLPASRSGSGKSGTLHRGSVAENLRLAHVGVGVPRHGHAAEPEDVGTRGMGALHLNSQLAEAGAAGSVLGERDGHGSLADYLYTIPRLGETWEDLGDSSQTVISRLGHVSIISERVFDELENSRYSLGADELGGRW